MAQSEHLPIYKRSYDLCLYLEPVVRGFSRYHKYTLGADLRDGAGGCSSSSCGPTRGVTFGPRYEVEGELTTPDGRRSRVRTVWQLDDGQIAPRLITAYPLEQV